MNTETQEILNDPEAMAAIGKAENEAVLASFKAGILGMAYQASLWGTGDGVALPDDALFEAVGDLMEQALKKRRDIRLKYKISLL